MSDFGSAAAGMLGAGIGLVTNLATNATNERIADQANFLDYKKWKEYLKYNTPLEQVKRLRQAGLNPALAMSNGAMDSGNASAPANPTNVPTVDFSPIVQGFRDSVELYQNARLQQSQKENLDAQTDNQHIRNKTQLLRDIAEFSKNANDSSLSASQREVNSWLAKKAQKEYETFDARNKAEVDLKVAQARESDAHANYLKSQDAYQKIVNQFTPDQQKILLRNLEKQGKAIDAAAYRDNEQGALAAAQKAVEEARKEGLEIENDVAEELADARVTMAYDQAQEQYYRAMQTGKEFIYGIGSKAPILYNSDGTYKMPPFRVLQIYNRKTGFKGSK